MKAIWKFKLKIVDEQVIDIPAGYLPLHVDEQGGELFAWFLVHPESEKEKLLIKVFGTGNAIAGKPGLHIGSKAMSDGFVWHVYYSPNS